MSENELTRIQLQVYVYFLKRNPETVTPSEIKNQLGLQKSTVHYSLNKLEKKQLIEPSGSAYKLKQFVPVAVLKRYLYVQGKLLPKCTVFLTVFAMLTVLSLLFLVLSRELWPVKLSMVVFNTLSFLYALSLTKQYQL